MSKMSLVSKGTVIATIIAMTLAAFSATSVFAAGSTTTATSTQAVNSGLVQSWKIENASIQFESAVLNRFDRSLDGTAESGNLVNRDERSVPMAYKDFSLILNKAQAVVSAHAGFDASGAVTDQTQAAKSVQDLSIYLSQLREAYFYKLRNTI
jgi:hypothetical protein